MPDEMKAAKVMKEFRKGTLLTGNGDKVKDRKQAIAIALQRGGFKKK